MPFQSQKQKRYMFAKHPKIAKAFVKHAKATGQKVVKRKKR